MSVTAFVHHRALPVIEFPLSIRQLASRFAIEPANRPAVLWMIFTLSVGLSTAERLYGVEGSAIWTAVWILGSVTCGWGWLLARSLFQPAHRPLEHLAVVAVFMVIGLQALRAMGIELASELVLMSGSTFVVLMIVEALVGTIKATSLRERVFAASFSALFIMLVAVSMFWGPSLSSETASTLQSICAVTAGVGTGCAVLYRRHYAFGATAHGKETPLPKISIEDERLAARMVETVEQQELFLLPDLKVADVAARMRAPDYKLTRCITGVLGYPNFNRFINERRIARARILLSDGANERLSILAVSLDCGFGSVGPFNRAFKEDTGVTPSAYRRKKLG